MALCTVLISGGCAVGKLYLSSRPAKSAKVIQTWELEEFVALVEGQLKEVDRIASAADDNHLRLPPLFPVPFDFATLPELRRVARAGDTVVWFQDKAWGHHIEYICVQRGGTIIWTSKEIWSEKDTLANHFSHPTLAFGVRG